MIGAIVKNDMVERLIVINEANIPEMEVALSCEIVDARPYGLIVGDFRTEAGWTRNADGEQFVLPQLEPEAYDSYTLVAERVAEAEARADKAEVQLTVAEDQGAAEMMAIIAGEVTA